MIRAEFRPPGTNRDPVGPAGRNQVLSAAGEAPGGRCRARSYQAPSIRLRVSQPDAILGPFPQSRWRTPGRCCGSCPALFLVMGEGRSAVPRGRAGSAVVACTSARVSASRTRHIGRSEYNGLCECRMRLLSSLNGLPSSIRYVSGRPSCENRRLRRQRWTASASDPLLLT
jgi:hypothetical protein